MITVTYRLADRRNQVLTESECYDSRPSSDELKSKRTIMRRRFYNVYHNHATGCDIKISTPDSETYDDGVFA